MTNLVQSFLEGSGTDHRGRRCDEILRLDDTALEVIHDYIQWLFPLSEPSAFNPHAPVLSPSDIVSLKENPTVSANLARATRRMEKFLENNDAWLRPYDHNHLRITRIIRSLGLLAGADEARRFHQKVEQLVGAAGNPVGMEAHRHWNDAVSSL